MYCALNSMDLKLSHFTLEFWGDFCDKAAKLKTLDSVQLKIWTVVSNVLNCILGKSRLENETVLY